MSNTLLKAALDVIEFKLKSLQERVDTVQTIKGDTGDQGPEGKAGKDGKDGKDGLSGPTGLAGKDGSDGIDGADGVGIEDAVIDIDGHLVLTLTNGNEIDAGDLTDTFQNSDKIVQIIRGGGGAGSKTIVEGIQSINVPVQDLEVSPLNYELDYNSFDITQVVAYRFLNSTTGCEVSVFNCKQLNRITMQSLIPLNDITLQVEYT